MALIDYLHGCSQDQEATKSRNLVTVVAAQNDPVIVAKLHFYMSVIRTFTPFLTSYQTDQPMMPFLANDLGELMKVIIFYD